MPTATGPFGHVRWLGGGSCSGKSVVAERLAERHGLHLYRLDDVFDDHRRRAGGELESFRALADTPPSRLLDPPAEEQARRLWSFYADEWSLVTEDLRTLSGPVLAEGAGWLPPLLHRAGVLGRAVWLVATSPWRRRVMREDPVRRDAARTLLAGRADEQAAFERWLRRDQLFAERLARAAEGVGGRVLEVDGRRSVEATSRRVAEAVGLAGV